MERNNTVDLCRGLLMMYIVCVIHPIFWLGITSNSIRSLFLFEMPCIFFVSGYSFRLFETLSGKVNSVSGYAAYLYQRGIRILAPYWFYAIFCVAFIFLKGDPSELNSTLKKILFVSSWANPLDCGRYYSIGLLRWHLWFIPPFIAITFIMPVFSLAMNYRFTPLIFGTLAPFAIIFADNFLDYSARTIITYSTWSMAGYITKGFSQIVLELKPYLTRILISTGIACMAVLAYQYNIDPISIDMQVNKFPPNILFLLFGLSWICYFLAAIMHIPSKWIDSMNNNNVIKFFISRGYSIYLWQGFGYTVAGYITARYSLPLVALVILSIGLTLFFGYLATPIERIRSKKRQSKILID